MARGRPAAHSSLDPPVSADSLAGCQIMRIGAVGATVVRGVLAALLLTAVPLAVPGPVLLHASQPQQQPPAEPPEEQPADALDEETALAGEPAEPEAAQEAADPAADAEQPDAEQPADALDEETALADEPAEPEAAQEAADPAADAEQPDAEEAEPPAGTFEAPAGLILSYIKSDGSGDFERVMTSLGAALAGSEDEALRDLLAGWRLYRAREPGPEGEILYVWLIDPAVAGADYAVPELLGAALPDESQALFDAFSEAFGSGQALINLEPVDIGAAGPE